MEAKNVVGHNNKPLGDWDVMALEDLNKFQIEEKNKKIQQKRQQKEMAAFYDIQKRDRSQNEAVDRDYYHSRIRTNDGYIEHPKNVGINFPG